MKHPDWDRQFPPGPPLTLSLEHIKIAAHEYTHGWLASLGCLRPGHHLAWWTNEGISEYIAFQALVINGHMEREAVREFIEKTAISSNETSVPLDSLVEHGRIWPGDVGYIAVDLLVRSNRDRILSLRTLCEEVGDGASVPDAFETAFGVSLDDFYAAFETHREKLNSPVEHPAPTSTPMGTKLPAGPTNIYYDIAANVPAEQVEIITTGLKMAQDFLDSGLGGGISTEARKNITVKIVATGRGNEEPWGGGACCTALSWTSGSLTMRPFFDVAHPHWDFSPTSRRYWTLDADHWKTAIHEYTHIWQFHLGCLSSRRLGNWLSEGMAEFIAYEAMIESGEMDRSEVMEVMLSRARGSGELSRPLRDFAEGAIRDIGVWPGHIGFLALHRILPSAPGGILSLRTLCEEVGDGASVPDAFETAFGVSLDDFYADFEKYREELNAG